jgi:putative redox protein
MNVRPKTTVIQRVAGKAESHTRTELRTRDLIYLSDEPEERGGTNKGFAPTELMLAALVSCTNVISHKIARKHGIEIHDMQIRVDARFDRRGVTLEHEVDVPYPQLTLSIELTTEASDEQLDRLKLDLPRFCAVSKIVRESGTIIDTQWIVRRRQGPL